MVVVDHIWMVRRAHRPIANNQYMHGFMHRSIVTCLNKTVHAARPTRLNEVEIPSLSRGGLGWGWGSVDQSAIKLIKKPIPIPTIPLRSLHAAWKFVAQSSALRIPTNFPLKGKELACSPIANIQYMHGFVHRSIVTCLKKTVRAAHPTRCSLAAKLKRHIAMRAPLIVNTKSKKHKTPLASYSKYYYIE
ncbi:hypothetical protein H8L32_04635 [Undibacterium sp. CY18W]|uniref:Uncharacterized protein n=1 Tax=Undibacterium hunanense TaxID=2762292 RepID=A0ABR6ZLI3_9BURK|nr:hypothetical protein [Undibacterium hunanense]MBC3916752.1 hypothetical protein [Undibacterium hunanense]